MRADVVKMYKDVHTWVGIFSGLCLLIAFYAGAITMFEGPLKQWASPPPELAAPVALSDTQALVDATLATNPDAARGYTIHVETGPDTPARMSWVVWPEGRTRGAPSFTYYSSFDEAGALQIAQDETSEVAEFVDILHRQVGLPFNAHISNIVMGVVAMLYAVAIVSGLIVLLPSLVKDLFELRMGKNLKRMWLDTHNVLGLFSRPFHIIMAVTALGFAFHDQVYDIQNKTIWDGRLGEMFEVGTPVHHADILEGQAFLPADQMLARVNAQVPEYQVKRLNYHFNRDNTVEVMVDGERDGYAHRGPDYGIMAVHAYTGDIMSPEYLPGHQGAYDAAVTSFFALHFGNFGGAPVRWSYVVLGFAGAFLFYTGNLLWIESRRKRARKSNPDVTQPIKTKLIGGLTTGVTFGCISGISITVAAAKILPGLVSDVAAAHHWIYYLIFAGAVAWGMTRGTARGAFELQILTVVAMLCIPAVSLLSALLPGFGWNHGGHTLLVDACALFGAGLFAYTAWLTWLRSRRAPEDSIWYVDTKAGHAATAGIAGVPGE